MYTSQHMERTLRARYADPDVYQVSGANECLHKLLIMTAMHRRSEIHTKSSESKLKILGNRAIISYPDE